MIPRTLFRLLQCPTCRSQRLYLMDDGLHCGDCQAIYRSYPGYLDLMPQQLPTDYTSKYVSEQDELAHELDYQEIAPPLLAAGVRHRTLQRMLAFRPHDIVLDNGCGNGRFALWNRDRVGLMVGSDPATLFADAALHDIALIRADTRSLPFVDHAFTKAFSIDVLEHFPRTVIDDYLRETQRVLCPGGRLLIFSNTREPSPIQPLINISRHIGRLGVALKLYDFEREARRKSDHIKALETWDDVRAAVERAGLQPIRVIFWNSLFTTFVEHVLMKLGDAIFGAAPKTHVATAPAPGQREIRARQRLRPHLGRTSVLSLLLHLITRIMELDVHLLGWMRCGTYFLLVEKPYARTPNPSLTTL